MPETPVGLLLPQTPTMPRVPVADDVGEFGRFVNKLGYDSLWINESWGTDPVAELTAVVRATDDLQVGTAVVNVFTRSPPSLAMTAASMARLSNNRFILGVGTGHPELVEDLHNVPWTRPIHRMDETLSVLRELLGDEPTVDYTSDLFDISGFPPVAADIPIYSAALGPANRRVTGKHSDGWIPYQVPFDTLESAFSMIVEAARDAGRNADDIAVVPYIACVVDEDADAARAAIRANVASYVGRFSDNSYKNAVGERFPEEAERIATAWRNDDKTEARSAVTDEMVHELGIAGTPSDARAQLADLRDDPFVDRMILAVPHAVDRQTALRTVEELAPNTT